MSNMLKSRIQNFASIKIKFRDYNAIGGESDQNKLVGVKLLPPPCGLTCPTNSPETTGMG